MRTPQGKILKSALVGCLRGSKEVGDTGKKVGFPKHAIGQAKLLVKNTYDVQAASNGGSFKTTS